jgi:hypothetical protein
VSTHSGVLRFEVTRDSDYDATATLRLEVYTERSIRDPELVGTFEENISSFANRRDQNKSRETIFFLLAY